MKKLKISRRSFINRIIHITGLVYSVNPTTSFAKKTFAKKDYRFDTNLNTYSSLAKIGEQAIKTSQLSSKINRVDHLLFQSIIESKSPMKSLSQHSSQDFLQLNIQHINGWALSTMETKFCIWLHHKKVLGESFDSRF